MLQAGRRLLRIKDQTGQAPPKIFTYISLEVCRAIRNCREAGELCFPLPASVVKNAKGKDTYETLLSNQFTVSTIFMVLKEGNNRIEALFLDS